MTRTLPYDAAAIAEAARLVVAGRPVAIPTETVYGLAADATRGDAVAAIYAAKGRPAFNPLIVHVTDVAHAEAIADLPTAAHRLAERFWPGPLSIVAPLRPSSPIASLATAGLPTVALRVPVHPAMRDLLEASGRPLAAPSANASNLISPTRAEHVVRSLGGRIDLVVDAGPSGIGLESTIVTIDGPSVRILRAGPIGAADLTQASGLAVVATDAGAIVAPGQLAHHYAPTKPLRLNAVSANGDEWLIGFGAVTGDRSLSRSGDLAQAAAALFNLLHEADAGPAARIAVAPIPERDLGIAINDRLRRAAA